MGLFSDLGKFGLGKYEKTDVFADEKKEVASTGDSATVEKKEEDFIYDKHYECPVCGVNFVSKCVKAGKVKLAGKDQDLRPVYEHMDPLKYDVITCDTCGYSAITRYFGKVSTRQCKELKQEVGSSFSGLPVGAETKFSYDDAILRYKLAVITTVVKKAKNSERAYTCLKLAWVLRGKRFSLNNEPELENQLLEEEKECLANAYEGFYTAISTEQYPIAGMDESTLKYILAELARGLKKYNESARLLADVITSKATSARLKDEALKLKDILKAEISSN